MRTANEILANIDRGVELGVIDDEEAALLRAQLANRALETEPPAAQQTPPDKPWLEGFTAPGRNDGELLVRALMAQGEDEAAARRTAMNPGLDMSDVIEREYAKDVEQAENEAKAKWLRTPDGKRHMAAEALAAQKKRAEDVELSRALLTSQGVPEVESMSDDEVLSVARLDVADDPDPTNHYGANVQAALAETPRWGDTPSEGAEGSAAE